MRELWLSALAAIVASYQFASLRFPREQKSNGLYPGARMSDASSTSTLSYTLRVLRQTWTKDAIFGRITVCGKDGAEEFKGYSMERIAVAIPEGVYTGRVRYSEHFDMKVLGIDVPNRTNIEIHPANFPSQLEGCIAIGSLVDGDALDSSREAFEALMAAVPESFMVSVERQTA